MVKTEPYLIGTKFMIWSHLKEDNKEFGGRIYTIETYRFKDGQWRYRSELPWISTASEMILVEMK